MNGVSILVISILGACTAMGLTWLIYQELRRRQARLQTTRMTAALATSHGIFTALDHVPDGLINRDLRRGLVLVLTHQLEVLRATNSLHPHLREMQDRVTKLNRLPSGLQRSKLRSKLERRHASVALAELAKQLKTAISNRELDQRTGALAHAAALFASQQMAVETARQAAKDAENVHAYPQALNFAHQAQALCNKLPPLIGKALTEIVSQDIERLEPLARQTARI